MNQIIKFPKEEIVLVKEITEAFNNNNYELVIKYKDKILEYFDFLCLSNPEIFLYLVISLFNLRKFQDVILINDEFFKRNYESFHIYFYVFASYLSFHDIFQAVQLIYRSKILQDESIRYYYSEDNTNFFNIFHLSKELYDMCGDCLILVNFILELSKERILIKNRDDGYFVFRYFDLLNGLYEIGYEAEIINKIENTFNTAFGLREI